MATISSPDTFAIPTSASPRPAPPPMVIPLFATTLRRHRPRPLAINENLPSKPRYCPYPQTKRIAPSNSESMDSRGSSSQPVSPLTPLPDDTCGENGLGRRGPQLILVPPPPGTLAVASLALHSSLAKDYRVCSPVAISLFNIACSPSDLGYCKVCHHCIEDGYQLRLVRTGH